MVYIVSKEEMYCGLQADVFSHSECIVLWDLPCTL